MQKLIPIFLKLVLTFMVVFTLIFISMIFINHGEQRPVYRITITNINGEILQEFDNKSDHHAPYISTKGILSPESILKYNELNEKKYMK